MFVKGSRYDKMMEAFGGVGVNATTPDELKRAVNAAMDSGKPTLINAVIDPAAGSESGRIGNLNPQSALQEEIDRTACGVDVREAGPQCTTRSSKSERTSRWPRSEEVEGKAEGKPKAAAQEGREAEGEEAGGQEGRTATACRSRRSKPYGQAGKALDGVRILDFTHVQSGPTCTQLLAYMGADVIKVERPGVGDITRGQLRDVKGADSLYFTMLNGNKRSITIDSKHPKGKEILERLIKHCDVLVENFAPGALDRMGLTWELHPQAQPAHDRRLGQGLRPRPLRGLQGLRERRAMRRRLGLDHRLPRRSAARHRRADRRQRHRPASRARHRVARSISATAPAAARRCCAPCRTACSTSRASSCATSSASTHGPLTEYSQYGEGVPFGEAMPRAGNDSGGGQPGWILKCKGWENDPDAYIYFITQAPVWGAICDLIGKPEWKTDPDYATPPARLPRLKAIFATIEAMDHDQDQVRGHGHLQRGRHSGRADPVDEGDRRGAVAARRPAPWSRSIIRRAASI